MGKRILGAIVFTGLWLAAPAVAQVESKCLSSQLKAGGAYADARAKCESKAAAKGEAVDPECLAKATEKAGKALAKAEGKEDCIVTAPDAAVDAVVDDFVQQLVDTLNPPPVICCAVPGPACFYRTDAAACSGAPLSGTPGAVGSVCNGDGTCSVPPATAGPCCENFTTAGLPFDCAVSSSFTPSSCGSLGGTFSSAVCTPGGSCQ